SLSILSTRDVFVVYCLLRKQKINWPEWILGYMLESSQDLGSNTSLPYRMIVTRIIKAMSVDVSKFPVKKFPPPTMIELSPAWVKFLMMEFGSKRQITSPKSSLSQL
ncbi:hypothetical protein HAX54_019318, partial [Datura stramonium]|nr:hypothetical protein [Datura stramonium]